MDYPTDAETAGSVLAALDPRLRRLYLEVWGMAHDGTLPLATQGIAKAWLHRMSTVLEAWAPRYPGRNGRAA